jgi:hypothetical protein
MSEGKTTPAAKAKPVFCKKRRRVICPAGASGVDESAMGWENKESSNMFRVFYGGTGESFRSEAVVELFV